MENQKAAETLLDTTEKPEKNIDSYSNAENATLSNKNQNVKTREVDNIWSGRTRWLCVVCFCISLVNILLLALIAIVLSKRIKGVCPDTEEYCLPCVSLSLSPGENKVHFREFGYDRVDEALDGDCCARNPEKLERLLAIFVKRKQRIRRLKEIENYSGGSSGTSGRNASLYRQAAHLVNQNQSERFLSDERKVEIEWDDGANNSSMFIQGFERRQNRVVILQSAYYYVYSQMMFEETGNSSQDLGNVCHFLMRYRLDSEVHETLLDNREKLVGIADQTHSSYLGAVFKLEKGDAVGVKVSGTGTRINPQKHSHGNFFGLYRV